MRTSGPARSLLCLLGALALMIAAKPASAAEPPRVAVLAFDNASGDPSLDGLGLGLQAMLTTDLAGASSLRLVERDKLDALRSELALQRGKGFDPATASRVGKLLGASHLLAGAITVVGEAMRLDARLVSAERGEVVLTAKIEGEREAFFELEKELVRRILAGLEVPVAPKERARIGAVHTADYQAFRRFSDGLFAFEQRRYDDARAALREAANLDEGFDLAKVTLADYEALIAKLEARADLQEEQARAKVAEAASAVAKLQSRLIEGLWQAARDTRPERQRERLAALYQLVNYHARMDVVIADSLEHRKTADLFLLERTGEALAKTYFDLAVARWPEGPLLVDVDFARAPRLDEDYERERPAWLERFFGEGRLSIDQRRNRLLDNLDHPSAFARMLHLDTAGEARFYERVVKLAERLDPDAVDLALSSVPQNTRRSFADKLGGLFRDAGLIAESTRWFVEGARASHDPNRTASMTREVERNRDIERLLAAHRHPRQREWLTLRRFDTGHVQLEEVLAALATDPPGPLGLRALAGPRTIRTTRDAPFLLLGEVPLFPLDDTFFQSGPRTDRLRSDRFSYYRDDRKSSSGASWVAVLGARPSARLELRAEVSYAPDTDWWVESLDGRGARNARESSNFVAARPELVALFGLVDVDVAPVPAPENPRAQRMQRPMRGYGARLVGDQLELVTVEEEPTPRNLSFDRFHLRTTPLASTRLGTPERVKLRVAVEGAKVTIEANKARLEAKLPSPADGFTGFSFLGPGYAGIERPALTLR